MWSSLSAYLYNDDANQDVAASSSSPSAAAAAVRRPPTKNNTPVGLRTPSPRSSPITVALSGGSKQGSAGKLNRTSYDRSDNVAILRGVIVGMKGTGKTSLIRRLRGEDPFFQLRSKSGQQKSSVDNKRKLMALVPWNIPTDTEKINNVVIEQDERVQLYVSESVGFVETQEERSFRKEWSSALHAQRGKEWNFAVWLIDPDMKNMLQYLQSGLDILFPSSAAAATSEKTKKQPLLQHLCILLNFRDTQQDGKLSTLSQARKVVESVRKNAKVGTSQESTKPPIILVYESSMRDCYGLEQLHSFITLPYLAVKEDKLMRQVKLAQLQQQKLSKSLMESKVADYNEFVAGDNQEVAIEEKPATPKQTVERRKLADSSKQTIGRSKLEEEREMLKKQLKQQQQELDKRYKMHRKKSPVIIEDQIVPNEPPKESRKEIVQETANHSRKLFQSPGKPETKKAVVPKKEVVETSLESFFAEDESDDEVEAPRQLDKRRKSPVASSRAQVLDSDDSSSDSDDSDDDFYIDIYGTRSTSVITKKSIPKIEPIVVMDRKQRNIEEKGSDANNESVSKENNEHDAEKENGSDLIHSDAVSPNEENENVEEAIRPNDNSGQEGGNSNAEDDKEGNDSLKLNEEDDSEKTSIPSEPIDSDSDAVLEDENYVAEYVTEEKDTASASDVEGKNEEEANNGTSNIVDNETGKMNGKDLVTESEVPAKETNIEDDATTSKVDETADANDDDASATEVDETAEPNDDDDVGTDSSGTGIGTDSPIINNEDATEEEKITSIPPKHQILNRDDSEEDSAPLEQETLENDDVTEENAAVASNHHVDDGCDGDEPEEGNTTTGTFDEDDMPGEINSAAAVNHQNQQTLNGGDESEEGKTASFPPQQQTPTPDGDGGHDSEDEFIVPASEEQYTRYDDAGGNESAAVASNRHVDDGCDGDEPGEGNPNTGTLDEDDVPEEENPAAVANHQTSNGSGESQGDKRASTSTASTSTHPQPPDDDDGNDSEDEFIVPASKEQRTRHNVDDGDDSDDEFIVPPSKGQPSDDESSKLSGDASAAVRKVDNGGIKFDNVPQKASPNADITETKTNGTSKFNNNNISKVSSAALAAIEQARLEAEQMMAQSQPQPTKPKKEKKKKKDKVKKEKKAKKSKKKEGSS